MSRGIWVSRSEAESTTLVELLDRYAKEVVPTKKGQAQEHSVLRVWRETELAIRTVAGVRSSDIASHRDEWLRSFEPATVLRRLSVLSHVFSIARREWGMESVINPVELVRKTAQWSLASSAKVCTEAEGAENRSGSAENSRMTAPVNTSGRGTTGSICCGSPTAMAR